MKNPYQQAHFLKSAPSLADACPDTGLEVAFAGRSNAGKSSAINTITNIKALARTSKTPGRTQHLVFFGLDDDRRLVDLPGYGYAKVSEKTKRQWQQHMSEYLHHRGTLQGVILVMDVRHPMTDYDLQMLEWCRHTGLAVHILLTKADKLKRGPAKSSLMKVAAELERLGIESSVQLFSSLKKEGVDDARSVLNEWLGYKDE